MNEHRCILCGDVGTVALGIRARYSNTNAAWAPNLDAWLCEDCTHGGCEIEVEIEPTSDGRVTTRTLTHRGSIVTQLIIGTGEKVTPGQGQLV